MNPLIFIHVPKTAGTSFRFGAASFFGAERVCCDYGRESSETNDVVRQWMLEFSDGWKFKRAFEDKGYQFLTGHFHAMRYAPIFGVNRMVTFLRDPIQRTVSEYRHFVRHNGFEDSFEIFYRAKENVNRQIRIVGNLPWPGFGFIGLTEHYELSLSLLNSKFGMDIPCLSENLSREYHSEPYEITAKQEAELRRLNAAELRFYDLVKDQFNWRIRLSEGGKIFVAGALMRKQNGRLLGWAAADEGDEPVVVQARANGEIVGEAVANEDRPGLREKGICRGGFVGFSFDVSKMQAGDSIECVVAATGQPIMQSPWKLQV